MIDDKGCDLVDSYKVLAVGIVGPTDKEIIAEQQKEIERLNGIISDAQLAIRHITRGLKSRTRGK